jgi:hypothetical protein
MHLHQAHQHHQVEGEDADNAISTTYFGSATELAAVQTNRLETGVQMKQRALSVFKKQNMTVIESNNNGPLDAEHQNGGGEQGEGADDATNNNPNSNNYQ